MMKVRFSRVNESDNSFDLCLVLDCVSQEKFEKARQYEAEADEPEEFVADLYDGAGIRDTICLTRQRMPIAAAVMKSTS